MLTKKRKKKSELNTLYPPLYPSIELNLFCQMIVPDRDARAGYVAKIFSQ
jgi:hypothetical protein